jgi:membrane protease YdiL (CAAX protease family)
VRLPDILRSPLAPETSEAEAATPCRPFVVAGTLVVGTGLLAGTLAVPSGSGLFYAFGLLLALVWISGGLLSGPIGFRGPRGGLVEIVGSIVVGAALFGAFFVVQRIADQVPVLSHNLTSVLARADTGPRVFVLIVALVNAVGEEVFFRGAVYSVFARNRPVVWSTVVYALTTLATLNLALVAAAVVAGTVFSCQRRRTGGVMAPILTHVSWSTLILFFLPR